MSLLHWILALAQKTSIYNHADYGSTVIGHTLPGVSVAESGSPITQLWYAK